MADPNVKQVIGSRNAKRAAPPKPRIGARLAAEANSRRKKNPRGYRDILDAAKARNKPATGSRMPAKAVGYVSGRPRTGPSKTSGPGAVQPGVSPRTKIDQYLGKPSGGRPLPPKAAGYLAKVRRNGPPPPKKAS